MENMAINKLVVKQENIKNSGEVNIIVDRDLFSKYESLQFYFH